MARSLRIEVVGFYHVINRGVAQASIFHDQDDFTKFLDIMQEASEEYNFEIYSFCLMNNHYHLLLKTHDTNLSRSMQKVNSRYSIYYNQKYKRVGPLWQGRFKSWYVYDEVYLKILVKYIEYNPIKASITKTVGAYKWAMSSESLNYEMLNYELLHVTPLSEALNENELERLDELYKEKMHMEDNTCVRKTIKPLQSYFEDFSQEYAIAQAIKDGYRASCIAEYLVLSRSSITKIMKRYKQKLFLFEKLKKKGIFWSYSKNASYENVGSSVLIEYTLKYADYDDIQLCLGLFGKREVKRIWDAKMKSDQSFIKTNLMLARLFFGMDVESSYFKEMKNERLEKLRLLAS